MPVVIPLLLTGQKGGILCGLRKPFGRDIRNLIVIDSKQDRFRNGLVLREGKGVRWIHNGRKQLHDGVGAIDQGPVCLRCTENGTEQFVGLKILNLLRVQSRIGARLSTRVLPFVSRPVARMK